MKCLTLTQPWATLVAIGAKQIETRSWSTSYRGPLAIHAAKGLGPGGIEAYLERCTASEPIYAALNNADLVPFTWDADALLALPRGAIVAVCELKDVAHISLYKDENWRGTVLNFGSRMEQLPDEPERSFGDYRAGRYAWLLVDVRVLPEPIPAKGALGLWTYEGVL
jgi:hypothetical protein